MTRRLWTLAGAAAVGVALSLALPLALPGTARAAVADRRADYEAALDRVTAVSAQHARVADLAAAAERRAEELRTVAGDRAGLVEALTGLFAHEPSALDRAAEAAQDAADARDLADLVHAALVERIAEAETARRAWERAERRRTHAEAVLTAGEYAERAIAYAQLPPDYAVSDPEQDRRNRAALRGWHDHLRRMAAAAVVPPPLARLADPAHLPRGLEPARDGGFGVSPGIAVADRPGSEEVTVLSAEAVRAVAEAFRRIGRPTDEDATTYACGGLVAAAWATPDLRPPTDAVAQWETLARVAPASAAPGDVVVLGSRRDGLAETGVVVGDGLAVVADPMTGVAGVRSLADAGLGVRRIGPPARTRGPAPSGGTCGATPAVGDLDAGDPTGDPAGGGPFVLPVRAGGYSLTAAFGDAGSHWSSGAHTGLDFAAPVGTPVVAAAAGTVTVEHPAWAGSLVRIDHGNGLETWYAHLSATDVETGDEVAAGAPVGLVGARGNTTGPHLHFEVRLDGVPYDPAPLLGLAAAGLSARPVAEALR